MLLASLLEHLFDSLLFFGQRCGRNRQRLKVGIWTQPGVAGQLTPAKVSKPDTLPMVLQPKMAPSLREIAAANAEQLDLLIPSWIGIIEINHLLAV